MGKPLVYIELEQHNMAWYFGPCEKIQQQNYWDENMQGGKILKNIQFLLSLNHFNLLFYKIKDTYLALLSLLKNIREIKCL